MFIYSKVVKIFAVEGRRTTMYVKYANDTINSLYKNTRHFNTTVLISFSYTFISFQTHLDGIINIFQTGFQA